MARTLTEDFIGVCQWCFGEYKVNSRHEMVLHGFTRPGYGFTVGQCRGVGNAPFEYSHELTDVRIEEIKKEIAKNQKMLASIDAGEIKKVPNPSYISPEEMAKKKQSRYFREPTENEEFYFSDHRLFAGVLRMFRANIENRVNYDIRTLAHFEQLVANWKRGQIKGIDVPATGRKREMIDAFDPDKVAAKAEREAAKAARDAKPGKITILLYRPSVDFYQYGEGEWDKRQEALSQHYADEAAFKKAVKAWAKETFPGKVWVGDAYSGDYARHDRTARNGSWAAVTLKVEWQYLDDVLAMFPVGDAVHRDDRGPKDVRLFVRGEAFPEGLPSTI